MRVNIGERFRFVKRFRFERFRETPRLFLTLQAPCVLPYIPLESNRREAQRLPAPLTTLARRRGERVQLTPGQDRICGESGASGCPVDTLRYDAFRRARCARYPNRFVILRRTELVGGLADLRSAGFVD